MLDKNIFFMLEKKENLTLDDIIKFSTSITILEAEILLNRLDEASKKQILSSTFMDLNCSFKDLKKIRDSLDAKILLNRLDEDPKEQILSIKSNYPECYTFISRNLPHKNNCINLNSFKVIKNTRNTGKHSKPFYQKSRW